MNGNPLVNIHLRPTSLEDVPILARTVDQVARERRYLGSPSGFSIERTRDFLRTIQSRGGIHLTVWDEDLLVGWCDVLPGEYEGLTHSGQLGMGLLPEYRGLGLGYRLLTGALTEIFRTNLERVELDVFASNSAAIALYRKIGFRQEGRKIHARKLDGLYDDILTFGILKSEWESCPDRHPPVLP